LLLHSGGLDLTYWGPQIAALRDDYDVVAIDLPGHGGTEGTPADWTVPTNMTEFILDVVNGLGVPGVHVVGLSVGGMLAQNLALSHPAIVRSLTLIDTAASFAEDARCKMRARAHTVREGGMRAVIPSSIEQWFTAETVTRQPDLIDRVTKTLAANEALIQGAMWDMIASFDQAANLPRIKIPTMVVVGEHDGSAPIAVAQEIRDAIDDARLAVIPNTAHLSPLERPATVNTLIAEFLAETY
jgi:3-oxoadipate enol-lactonase